MPTNRKRISRKSQAQPWKIEHLLTGQALKSDGGLMVQSFLYGGADLETDWCAMSSGILAEWTREHPCTRPWAWWQLSAPRQPHLGTGHYLDGKLPQPRMLLAGQGKPRHEVLAYVPAFEFGIPALVGTVVDDPPHFESEAAYLKRHGLLTESEKRWLAKHPEALEPDQYGD